ncbi:MAG: methyltransferase domain-containing protein [bacterium]
MKKNEKNLVDAYGQYLLGYLNGERKPEIVERDDNFISVGERFGGETYFSDYKKWSPLEKKAIKYAKGKVLDIGCGAGRHSLYLQKLGFDVVGIDNSPLAIKVCELRGLKKAKVLPIDGIDEFKKDSFDSILMLGHNFGLFGNFNRAKSLLKKMYKITSDNALIIAETRDPYLTNDQTHLNYHKLNLKRGRMAGQLRIRVRYNNLMGPWFDYLFVSKKEMENFVEGTGWCIKKFIDYKDSGSYVAIIGK